METLTKPWAPTEEALRDFIANFINVISPKLNTISENLYNVQVTALAKSEEISESTKKDMEMFKICSDQILKCSCLMASIFKAEISTSTIAEETRNWVLDRIFWCFDKLEKLHLSMSTTKKNKKPTNLLNYNDFNIFVGDSFVTWVDDTLKILDTFESLFETDSQYSTLNRSDKQIFNNKCCLGLFNFHKAVGELIFAAMNIRQNCLPSEQHIINARCHVVLRETKNLMNELSTNSHLILIENDELESGHIILKNELHFPTIRMFIDVLRDGIYILEASVNRAVLSLVLKCLTDPVKPLNDIRKWQSDELDKLIDETSDPKQLEKVFKPKDLAEMRESSVLIKEFDMHNEQIIQIGLFAISCSSDKQRVLQLKSCLASLEVLEAHLIPSVLIDAQCLHTDILANHWIKEINMLRTCVFLIVDPVAFTDLVKEQFLNKMMHLKEMDTLESVSVCQLIDLGQCVLDYFTSYFEYEPNVLQKYEKLHSIVADIVKVVKECKAVVDLFLSNSDMKIIENPTSSNESNKDARVLKRLKLLYSLISKLSQEFVEKDECSEIFDDEEISHTLSDNSSNAPKCKIPDNATVNSKVPNKAKGLFKIFDLFKVGNKCSNSSLKAVDKTYTRSTIMRANKFKTNRQHIILQSNNINDTVVIKPTNEYMSASGILNCTDTEYALANISGFDNIEKVNETENLEVTQKNLDSLVNKRNNTTMKKSKFYKERINGLKKRRNSLRRRVILNETNKKKVACFKNTMEDSLESRSLDELNESFDLQITEILEQITTMSDTMSLLKMETTQRTSIVEDDSQRSENVKNTTEEPANVLTLRVNKTEQVTPKRVWNIRVYDENVTDLKLSDSGSNKRLVKEVSSNTVDDIENMHATPKIAKKLSIEPDDLTPVNENVDCEIDISHGSNISTPERLNDLHLLEKKLAALKDFWDKNNAKK